VGLNERLNLNVGGERMDGTKLTKEIFLNDVSGHSLKIIKDDGLYRHIECSNNGSFNQRFEIVTWPGYLAYTGDMGDYLFSRVDDMFSFFRSPDHKINTGYWAEKCKAQSVYGNGIREFSVERFRECVLNDVRGHLDIEEDDEIPDDIMEEIEPLLNAENEHECAEEMMNFSSSKMEFNDFWEHTVTQKTWHFIWCCHAIVWAINQYDEMWRRKSTPLNVAWRPKMKILHLTLKKKWFDMILSGEKKEEYREIKPYWTKRLMCVSPSYTHIKFINGYGRDRPSFVIEKRSIFVGYGRKSWGAPEGTEVYVLRLGNVLTKEYLKYFPIPGALPDEKYGKV